MKKVVTVSLDVPAKYVSSKTAMIEDPNSMFSSSFAP
jgi:hypothetical protein